MIRCNGKGTPERLQEQIFDPFFSTRLHEGGSGLGLSVTDGIVSSHGGKIHVNSQLGRGTTVSLELPLGKSQNKRPA